MVKVISIILSKFSDETIEKLSKLIAFFIYNIARFKRGLVISNLDKAFGDEYSFEKKKEIGYKSIFSFLHTEMEFLASRGGRLAEKVSFVGKEHLENALGEGSGAYVLCIHMGSWEAMGAAMTKEIETTNVVVKKVGGPKTDAYITWLRELNGFRIIKRKKKGDAFKGIKETISANKIVGFVMDQARPGEPYLPFFGHPAKTNTSLAAILQRCPAPVIPGYCKRFSDGKYRVEFLEPLELKSTGDSKLDIIENSKIFNFTVEKMIRKCPEQYFWLHNRWK